jgi:hypothetical protein
MRRWVMTDHRLTRSARPNDDPGRRILRPAKRVGQGSAANEGSRLIVDGSPTIGCGGSSDLERHVMTDTPAWSEILARTGYI